MSTGTPSLDLAIVIVSFNVRDLLRECLESLALATACLRCDVFVVDCGSVDDTSEMVRAQFPWVKLRQTPNIGFARGNNVVLREILASAPRCGLPRYVLLLNPDTIIPSTAIQEMVSFLDERPQVGVAGPKLLRRDGSLDLACRRSFPTPAVSFWHFVGLARLFPRSPRFARYNLTFLDPDAVAEVDSVVGAFMLVRGTLLETIGLLDEAFFMYGEDLDWALRIKQAGWKVLYNGSVTVYHLKRASSRQRTTRSVLAFYEAMLIFFRKHYAPQTVWPVRLLVVVAICLRAALALAFSVAHPRGLSRSVAAR